MAKTRVYELARELHKNSKEILQLLEDSGVHGKNHMSALEDNVVRFIKNRFAEMEGKAPAKKEARAEQGKDEEMEDRARAVMRTIASSRPSARNLPDILPQRSHPRDFQRARDLQRGQDFQRNRDSRPRGDVNRGVGAQRLDAQRPATLRPTPGAAQKPVVSRLGFPARPAGQAGQAGQVGAATQRPGGHPGSGARPAEPAARKPGQGQQAPVGRVPQAPAPTPVRPAKPVTGDKEQATTQMPVQTPVKVPEASKKGPAAATRPEPAPVPVAAPVTAREGQLAAPHAGELHAGKLRDEVSSEKAGQPTAPRAEGREKRPKATPRVVSQGAALRPEAKAAKGKKPQARVGDRVSRVVGERLARHRQVEQPAKPVRRRERPQREHKIVIPETITVKELAEKLEAPASDVIKTLMGMGVLVTINQEIDYDTAAVVADEYGFETERPSEKEAREFGIEDLPDPPETLKPRPPVVTIMGHVDHGKTSLLDAIRETNVTAQEAGGITQHIGAYQVELKGKKITFIDTPGHEAFTEMRARGAQVTDIAVLVVAADDGVMPQTVEALNHARAANVPIIVAINKIDKPNAQPDRVRQQLSDLGLIPESWGGDTVMVEVSAVRKQGIEDLLEMILLVAEMRELKANPDRPARGTVIESQLDKGRGPVATVLVEKGTLRIGDAIVAGEASGRVRAMLDYRGNPVIAAGPSMPVEVLGLSEVPNPGDIMTVVPDDRLAKELAERRQDRKRAEEIQAARRLSLEDVMKHIKEGEIKELNLIIKGDVQGSVEALKQACTRLSTDEVKVNVIHSGVGGITESDVMLASASRAIIIGFQVRPDANARKTAEREGVDLRTYSIIYDATADIKAAMEGLLEPEYHEVQVGRAEVRATFKVPKVGTIAGVYVVEGKITRDANVRVVRDQVVIYEGKVASLKRFKDDVREVPEGFECGLGIENFNDVKEGDIIEAFRVEEARREL
ncbi:MAG TPA: translation initiation factor IF-2 [Firmicutes bacterium]|nr:translation initiation factor IF-2 [Bacillota bacterium]